MLDFWLVAIYSIIHTGVVHMKKKKSIYMGGELDPQNVIMPKYYEVFFSRQFMFFVLILLLVLLLFMRLNL